MVGRVECDAMRTRKKEKKAPSKRVLVGVVGRPDAERWRTGPGVEAALLDQLGTLAVDGRHHELTVTGSATVAESAARRVQKKQEKAVSRRHWPGGGVSNMLQRTGV